MSHDALHKLRCKAMNCLWGIDILHDDSAYAEQAAQAAFDEVNRLENELSRYRPASDIARINAAGPGETLTIGADCHDCLRIAARVWQSTAGAFDVTYHSRSPNVAAEADVDSTRQGRMNALDISERERRVTVLEAGVHVDLGAIGKGYALDRVLAVLTEWSIENCIVNSGQSTVLSRGCSPDGTPWRVDVRHPLQPETPLCSLDLAGWALGGSGNALYRPHVRDPRDGGAARGALAAWALAPTAALADALSTAFLVMPPVAVADFCRANADACAAILAVDPAAPSQLTFLGTERFDPKPLAAGYDPQTR